MATEKIIVEYVAQVDGLKAELKSVQQEMHNTEKAGTDAGKKTADAFAKTEEKTVSLKTQLKNLKAQLAIATDPKEIERLAKAAGALTDQLQDAGDAAKVFASESKFEQMGSALGSVKDKLMNLDFKGAADQSKLLVSVVKSFSVQDVVSGIKDIGTAFLNIGQALLANPLFLIVGAIAAASYAVYDLATAFDMVGVQTQTVTDAIKEQEKTVQSYTDKMINAQIKAKESLGIYTKEQANQARLQVQVDKDLLDQKEKHNQKILDLAKEIGVDLNDAQDGWFSEYYKGNADELALRERFNAERTKLELANAKVIGSIKGDAIIQSKLIDVEASAEEIKKKKEDGQKKLDEEAKNAELLRQQKLKDAEKAKQDLADLYDAINQLDKQYQLTKLDADGKELQALYDKYDKIRLRAKGNADALMQIEKLYNKELNDLIYKQSEADKKYDADKLKSKQDIEDKIYLATLSANDKQIVEEANKWDALIMEAENAGLDATLLRQKQADAINAIVKKQAEDEVKVNKDKNKKLMTDDEKRAWVKKELEDNAFNYMKQAGETIISFMKNVNERSLDDVKTKGDEEVALLDAQLANKEISQEIYNERKIQIEKKVKEEENKIKLQQFKLDKQQAIINIAISTAESISKTIANVGLPIGLPLVAIAAAFGLAQIALVESQPTPKFEKGGEVGGKLHRQGGTLIEAERGEYIINRKHSKENKSLLEAINTGNGSKYIEDKFIAPMLKEQQKKFNQLKDSAFSDNLVNSMILNSSNFKDSNLLDSMKRSRQADKENALLIINSLKSNNNSRKW